jgi:hypothetical protein
VARVINAARRLNYIVEHSGQLRDAISQKVSVQTRHYRHGKCTPDRHGAARDGPTPIDGATPAEPGAGYERFGTTAATTQR